MTIQKVNSLVSLLFLGLDIVLMLRILKSDHFYKK